MVRESLWRWDIRLALSSSGAVPICQSVSEHPSQLLARPTSLKSWHSEGGVTAVNLLAKFSVTLGSVGRRSEVTYAAVVITV